MSAHREYLDAQYNLRARHPEFQVHFDRWQEQSTAVRRQWPCRLDLAYGQGSREALDVFPALSPGGAVLVFIHGGYWQNLDKHFFSFIAPPFLSRGAAVVLVNYGLAPAVTMDAMVAQVRRAFAWVSHHAAEFNGHPDRLHLVGHSAGGHLAALCAATDWEACEPSMLTKPLQSLCTLSGIFDLEPIRLSYLNDVLGLDPDAACRNTPLFHLPEHPLPLMAAVGEAETEEYLRQSAALAAAWRARNYPTLELRLPGLNHFSIVEELGRENSALCRQLCFLLQDRQRPSITSGPVHQVF